MYRHQKHKEWTQASGTLRERRVGSGPISDGGDSGDAVALVVSPSLIGPLPTHMAARLVLVAAMAGGCDAVVGIVAAATDNT